MKVNKDIFWARYGHEKWEETFLVKTLARLPTVGADGPWVCGGSIRRLVMHLPQDSDFDFFFKNADQFAAFSTKLEALGGQKLYENEFNVTWKIPAKDKMPEIKVQAIRIAYHENIEAVLNSFDFSLCQCGFDGTDLYFGEFTLFDLASNKLIPEKISYGVSSLRRIIKYTRQGYGICGGGLANVLEQICVDPKIINKNVEYVD